MLNKKNIFLFLFLFIITQSTVRAQSSIRPGFFEADDHPFDNQSHIMIGLNGLSNNVYLGRKDTVMVPYITPYFGFKWEKGLTLKGMLSYAATPSDPHIDLLKIEAGYDKSYKNKLLTGSTLDVFFYSYSSLNVRASTIASLSAYAQYINEFVNPTLIVEINRNKNSNDIANGVSFEKIFQYNREKLNIVPSLAIYAGTQNFYNDYYINHLIMSDVKHIGKRPVVDAAKYKLLDIEPSVKVTYEGEKWFYTFIPTIVLPINAPTISIPAHQLYTDKLTTSFTIEVDVYHR